jgi:hypothetical protein
MRILVIEDEAALRETLARRLTDAGYSDYVRVQRARVPDAARGVDRDERRAARAPVRRGWGTTKETCSTFSSCDCEGSWTRRIASIRFGRCAGWGIGFDCREPAAEARGVLSMQNTRARFASLARCGLIFLIVALSEPAAAKVKEGPAQDGQQ